MQWATQSRGRASVTGSFRQVGSSWFNEPPSEPEVESVPNLTRGQRVAAGVGAGLLLSYGLREKKLTGVVAMALGGALLHWAITGQCALLGPEGLSAAPAILFKRRRNLARTQAMTPSIVRSQELENRDVREDIVDEASDDSFPASDPPGWISTRS